MKRSVAHIDGFESQLSASCKSSLTLQICLTDDQWQKRAVQKEERQTGR